MFKADVYDATFYSTLFFFILETFT